MAYLNLLNSAAIQASCYLLIGYPVFHWLLKFPVKNVRWGAFKLAAWRFGDTTYTVGWLPINAFFEFPEEFLEARTTKQRINGAIAQLMIHLVMLIACVLLGSISLAELGDGRSIWRR